MKPIRQRDLRVTDTREDLEISHEIEEEMLDDLGHIERVAEEHDDEYPKNPVPQYGVPLDEYGAIEEDENAGRAGNYDLDTVDYDVDQTNKLTAHEEVEVEYISTIDVDLTNDPDEVINKLYQKHIQRTYDILYPYKDAGID